MSTSTKPPAGYHPAPRSKHGGWTDGHGNYWYADQHKLGEGAHKHESGRWIHNDADLGNHKLNELINEPGRDSARTRNKALDHHASGVRELEHHRNKGDHAVVIPDASHPGKFRYSEYDAHGFRGHKTFDTEAEAHEAAADAGYRSPAPGSLGELASTQKWAEGTRHAKVMQLVNSLRDSELGDAAMDYYARHGKTQAALDTVLEHRKELRAGKLPAALKKARAVFGKLSKGGPYIGPRGGK